MTDSTRDLVAEFLAKGGAVKNFAPTYGTGRTGKLLGIREVPVGDNYRSLAAFRLRVHFSDTNTQANVACTLKLREGLEVGKSYRFPTQAITPHREPVSITDQDGNLVAIRLKRLEPRVTALRLIGPAVEI